MLPYKVPDSLEEAIQPVQNPRDDETLPVRVKELIVMFDTKNRGFLTIEQVGKLLKKLSGFTNSQIAGFCSDIDRSKDGKVSCREFLDWVQKGGGTGGEQVAKAIIRETNKRAVRIKAAFDRYDDSGDGSLGLSELKKVLRTLGAFTNNEIGNVLADMDRSGDGEISFPEFAEWVRRASEMKEVIKAKCILAPSDSDGIEPVFYNFCGAGHADMDGKSFLKLVKDCKLLNRALTETSVDLLFSDTRVRRKHQRRIEFSQFEIALELVAEKRGSSIEDVHNAMLNSTHPVLKGTKADFVRFHDGGDGEKEQTPAAAPSRKRKLKKYRVPGQLPSGKLSDELVDNTNLWKIFGRESEAGRCLKLLYTEKRRPSTATTRRFKARWPPAMETWVAVNPLDVCTCGVRFRQTMDLSDTCPDPLAVIRWGESVRGEQVAWSWLRVGSRYLPTDLNGVQVMKKWTEPDPPPPSRPRTAPGGLRASSSLPSLRSTQRAFDLKGLPSTITVTSLNARKEEEAREETKQKREVASPMMVLLPDEKPEAVEQLVSPAQAWKDVAGSGLQGSNRVLILEKESWQASQAPANWTAIIEEVKQEGE